MTDDRECFIFRDLYGAYLNNEVEEDTGKWMKEHITFCGECRKWTKGYMEVSAEEKEQYNEGKIYTDTEKEKLAIKRAKLLLAAGMIIVIFMGIWVSLWIYN